MIDVAEATRIILAHTLPLAEQTVPLATACGRVLREPLIADRDFPPFDRVTMDGIAIDYTSWQQGRRTFHVQQTAAAGEPQASLLDPAHCIAVMTGAVLPEGCDTVIRIEDVTTDDDAATINAASLSRGQNVHRRGEDRSAGSAIVSAGTRISAAEIGVAATVGMPHLRVSALPATAIVSTGDELVPVDVTPAPHQIRMSNAHQVAALLAQQDIRADLYHVQDTIEDLLKILAPVLERYSLVILIGGVSKGKYDYVPGALARLGVRQLFHHVAQRPGKPFWFGATDSSAVFALPGNPVSAFLCSVRYVLPWVNACQGLSSLPQYAVLTEDVTFKPALTLFLQVRLQHTTDGTLQATPVPGHGSGDLANLVHAHAFLELPAERERYEEGGVFEVWKW